MKRLSIVLCACVLGAAGLAIAFLTGCEADSATEGLTVNPSSVTVKQGQTVEFTVSGGYEYSWSLDPNDGSGSLSSKTGDRTVYTCLETNGSTPKKVVVTSTISGTSTEGGSNSTAYSVSGFAEVFYEKPSESSTNESAGPLTVRASATSVNTNGTVTLTALGGKEPYSWTKNKDLGSLSATTGEQIIFTYDGDPGDVKVTCTDATADSESVTITQN